jgi:hypothetical protein
VKNYLQRGLGARLEENGGQTVAMKCKAAAVRLCARVRGRREEERERRKKLVPVQFYH